VTVKIYNTCTLLTTGNGDARIAGRTNISYENDGDELIKFGRTTGYTIGKYNRWIGCGTNAKVSVPYKRHGEKIDGKEHVFDGLLELRNVDSRQNGLFFDDGDSGAAVLLKKESNLYVVGIAMAYSDPNKSTSCFIMPIDNILSTIRPPVEIYIPEEEMEIDNN